MPMLQTAQVNTPLEALRPSAITTMIEHPSTHSRLISQNNTPSRDRRFTVHCKDLKWLTLAPKAEKVCVLPRHRQLDSAEIYVMKGSWAHPQIASFAEGDYVSESKGAIHDHLAFENDTELSTVSRDRRRFRTTTARICI
ncbi:hypothetical protein ABOM_007356 [Aspergillus bombycis]|uniref:ChrR-like cupin domain-containing protein n=1 Tax=Aspergillus bombycis TaxID=109264 RepID=A0A1F7ZZ18_9EURO|nr:hypothetical protein ABOM_007356 [Aspergillus bombycis]OGM44712.1 hypothetical protein ABOM_007356 [Aspergillus bombycis]